MRRKLKVLLVSALAAGVTLASSVVPSKVRVVYPGTLDCEQGCNFLAGGWPFPFIVDHHGISPTGSVSLFGSLIGVDIMWYGSLAATFVFWLAAFGAASWVLARFVRAHAA